MEEIGYQSNPLDIICYACLSQTRQTFPLRELGEFYNKIITFSKSNIEEVKLCWECLAVLKKFKKFETKCYIAQQALSRLWNGDEPECLSNLVTAPTKVHYIVQDDVNALLYDEVKAEKSSDHDEEEPFDSFIDETTNELPINYEDLQITKSEFDETNDNDVKIFGDVEKTSNNPKVEITVSQLNSINKDVITEDTDDTSHLNVKVKKERGKDSVKKEKNGKVKFKDRRSLKEGALDGHYTLVKNESGAKLLKVNVNSDELEAIIQNDRTSDFFVNARFKCEHCIVKFPNLKHLHRHNSNFHVESLGKYICTLCKIRFPSKSTLHAHTSKHNFVHKCSDCELLCFSKQRLRIHLKLHKKAIKCDLCGQQFVNLVMFAKHFKANHSVYICDHCGKKCRTKYTIEKHMRRHMEPNICSVCKKVYKSRTTLKHHMHVKHTSMGGELAYCVQCDKQFANVALYKRHIFSSSVHKPERNGGRDQRQVKCPLCEKVYSRRCYMMNHYRHVHMKQSNFYCADCDRYFLNRTRYVEHRQYNHEGKSKEKNKICNFCGKAFAAKRTLLNHIRTHSGERPYDCDFCDASFTQKHCMTAHYFLNRTRYVEHRQYNHEGKSKEKNKICNFCGKAFAAKRTLLNHIRTHSGERPYDCDFCDASFTRKHCMTAHVKYIHLKSLRRGIT